MNRKKLLIAFGLIALVALAGCAEEGSTGESLDTNTTEDVNVGWPGESYAYEVRITEQNQIGLVKEQPPFTMEQSLERQNLIDRYKYLNDRDNVHYVYFLSNDGKVISHFVAQGKVSSVNSKLTNDKQVVRIPDCNDHNGGNDCWKKVESPQMDGSYGTNGNAIFFFTTDGRYVEWNGKYVVSEEPLEINTPVSLEKEISDDE